jgi:hypothetical protein
MAGCKVRMAGRRRFLQKNDSGLQSTVIPGFFVFYRPLAGIRDSR